MTTAAITARVRRAVKILEGKFPHPRVGCRHGGILSGVSIADWAVAAGVTPVYLGRLVNGAADSPRTSYEVVKRLADVAGLSMEEVWVVITRNRDGTVKRAVKRRRKGKKGRKVYA